MGRSGTDRGTVKEVRNGLGDSWGGPERIGRPSDRSGTSRGTRGRFATGRETLGEDRDGSRDSRGGSGWVGGPLRRFGTG